MSKYKVKYFNHISDNDYTLEQEKESHEELTADSYLALFSEVVDDESYDVEAIERYIENQISEIENEN